MLCVRSTPCQESVYVTRFRTATDLLCMNAVQLGELFDVSPQTIRQARLDPEKDGYRSPPQGWEKRLARLARQRAEALVELAEELED